MIFHNVFSIDEAHNEALKIKRLQNRASSFKNVTGKTSSSTRTQQSSTSGDQSPAHKATDALTTNPMTMPALTTKGKEIPYAKPGVGKCYKCGEL